MRCKHELTNCERKEIRSVQQECDVVPAELLEDAGEDQFEPTLAVRHPCQGVLLHHHYLWTVNVRYKVQRNRMGILHSHPILITTKVLLLEQHWCNISGLMHERKSRRLCIILRMAVFSLLGLWSFTTPLSVIQLHDVEQLLSLSLGMKRVIYYWTYLKQTSICDKALFVFSSFSSLRTVKHLIAQGSVKHPVGNKTSNITWDLWRRNGRFIILQ